MTSPPTVYEHALVIGLGRSGKAAANLLSELGVWLRVYDQRAEVGELPVGCEPWLGEEMPPEAAFEDIDLLVLSPGVDPRPHLEIQRRVAPNAKVHGELSLALEVAGEIWPRTPTVLITGTNGKSTVTALTGHMLRTAGFEPFVGGNLAVPLCEEILEVRAGHRPRPGALVIECSSYQLETFEGTPTDVGMILNLTPDHLDRYEGMEDYGQTKARIFTGLGSDGLALLDADSEWTPKLAPPDAQCQVRLVGSQDGPHLIGERLSSRLWVDGDGGEWARSDLPLPGRHNAKNALLALAAARHVGLTPAACLDGIKTFEGLPHRMRRVDERGGIVFFDDSKATNVAAVLASLDGFERRFVLIAGGRAKGDDLAPLQGLLAANGRGLVAIGEARDQFEALGRGVVPTAVAETMEQAVRLAADMAESGDAVVLSPACASWDMYSSYAERGRDFARAIEMLAKAR